MSFNRLQPEDFLISADSIAAGCWTGNSASLSSFNTYDVQTGGASGQYYYNVYQKTATEVDAEVQFAVAYGNINGSGSVLFDVGVNGKAPTSVIYGQFQNIILGDEDTNFTYGSITPAKADQYFWAISVNRARFKGNMLPASLDLLIDDGSNGLQLTDNSADIGSDTFTEAGRVYQVISGSNGSADATSGGVNATYGSYGLFLPDIGVVLLNGPAIVADSSVEAPANNTNQDDLEPQELIDNLTSFRLNSNENITSDYVFIRARNSEYNYSENPSFITGSTGEVKYSSFINAPQTFITTVGLYNDNNDLLAVAKLSKPLKKDFTKEALIRVKLDF